MTEITPWLRPSLLGPLATLWALVTLGSLLAPAALALAGPLFDVDLWLVALLNATFIGSFFGVLHVGCDVLFLAQGLRRLPTGIRAWGMSVGSPLLTLFLWSLLPPPENGIGLLLFLVLPMTFSVGALRYGLGEGVERAG